MSIRKHTLTLFLAAIAVVSVFLTTLAASADMPDLMTGTFPPGTYVIPMDTQQDALTTDDTTVYGFIWKVLDEGAVIHRIIQPPDSVLFTDAHPGGRTYSGGVILILPMHSAAVAAAQAAFPSTTVHTLTEPFTSDRVFRVEEPTSILVIRGEFSHTEAELTAMGIPFTAVNRSDVNANPSILFDYNLVIVDCPGWGWFDPMMTAEVAGAFWQFAETHGGELIFTDIALQNLRDIFAGYITTTLTVEGIWDTAIHNPPISGFVSEYPSQYPSDFPNNVKIFTLENGQIVVNVLQPDEVRVWMDCDDYGPAHAYRVLGFYFPLGDGLVEGMAYHPQEQTEPYTGDPDSFVAGTIFFGNKLVFARPLYRLTLNPTSAVNVINTSHQVTATLRDTDGNPVEGQLIQFEVISGPHAGEASDPGECSPNADCTTDAGGQVSWSYMGTLSGDDTIVASGGDLTSNLVFKTWTPAPTLTLAPDTATNDVGDVHTVTATLKDSGGNPIAGETIDFSVVSGPHAGEVSDDGECSVNTDCTTDASGQVSWSYTGSAPGEDTIVANGMGLTSNEVTKLWEHVPVCVLTLEPGTASNPVGDDHQLTATLLCDGIPVEGETIDFLVVSGPHVGEASDDGECSPNTDCTTDASGQVSWSYTGSAPGEDAVTASGLGLVSNQVSKTWEGCPNLTLEPQTASNILPGDPIHTVTATLLDALNVPMPGQLISFEVTSGPNAGQQSMPGDGNCSPLDCTTDVNGQVSWTYAGSNAGIDTIEARSEAGPCTATDEANKTWLRPNGVPGMTWWSILLAVVAIVGVALAMLHRHAQPGRGVQQ